MNVGGLRRRVVAQTKWIWTNRSAASRRRVYLILAVVALGLLTLAYRAHFVPKELDIGQFELPEHGTLTLKVHIAGAVARPGLYDLTPPKRVYEAITAAGGLLPEADRDRLNLAKFVEDGDRILVRERKGSTRSVSRSTRLRTSTGQLGRAPGSIARLSVNLGSEQDLQTLPGIGPATARRIADYRESVGRIQSLDELTKVKGIGPKTLAKLRPYLSL